MLGNGIYVSTSIGVTDGVQWAAPCKAECHLIDKESTEESVSLLATYLERTYSLDLIGAIAMIRHYPYTAL